MRHPRIEIVQVSDTRWQINEVWPAHRVFVGSRETKELAEQAVEQMKRDWASYPYAPSEGQVAVTSDLRYEFFLREGEVYRAPLQSPVMTDGYRCGRWECSATHFERNKSALIW